MASTSKSPTFRVNKKDRLSTLLTIAVTVVALMVGLLLRNGVESRTKAFQTSEGISVQYPAAWRLSSAESTPSGVIVQARDVNAQDFPTTLELRTVAVEPTATDEDALGLAAGQVALNRAQNLADFKMFDILTGQTVKGLPGATTSFVFVNTSGNALQEDLPVVVLGDDILVRKGGTVYVFSLLSSEENRPQSMAMLRAFVDSAQLP
jgi:hypothetical protein